MDRRLVVERGVRADEDPEPHHQIALEAVDFLHHLLPLVPEAERGRGREVDVQVRQPLGLGLLDFVRELVVLGRGLALVDVDHEAVMALLYRVRRLRGGVSAADGDAHAGVQGKRIQELGLALGGADNSCVLRSQYIAPHRGLLATVGVGNKIRHCGDVGREICCVDRISVVWKVCLEGARAIGLEGEANLTAGKQLTPATEIYLSITKVGNHKDDPVQWDGPEAVLACWTLGNNEHAAQFRPLSPHSAGTKEIQQAKRSKGLQHEPDIEKQRLKFT